MNSFKLKALPAALLALGLTACGGGGGGGGDTVAGVDNGPSQGISGSGATTSGTIDGFGSIFVNGVEFETDDADITIDGRSGSEDDLGIGMVVLVKGTVNDDGVTGTATQVIFDDEVEGPVSAIQAGQDNDSKLLTILGIDVIVERTGTVFEDVTFDTLAIDDVYEVSGFRESGNNLRATRVEKKSDFVPGQTEVEVKGQVQNLTATEFNLGDFTVDYSNADLTEVSGGSLTEGQGVEVYGTVEGQVITATRVEDEDDITDFIDDDDDFSIQGAISNFVSAADFEINGIKINAGNASLFPSGLTLANGVVVEYLVFEDEGHGFRKKENRLRGYRAIRDFCDKHLRGAGVAAR